MSHLDPRFHNGLNAYMNAYTDDLVKRAHAQGYQEGMREGVAKATRLHEPPLNPNAAVLVDIVTRLDRIEEAIKAMPLKPRAKVKAGSKKFEPGYEFRDGKIVPVEKRKPIPQRIKARKKQKWRPAK